MRKTTRVQPVLSKNVALKGRKEMKHNVERNVGSEEGYLKWAYFGIFIC